MSIDQTFADSANDPTVTQLIGGYITSRDILPACNCGTPAKACNGVLRACRHSTAPDGGMYTKLDRGTFLEFDYQTSLSGLDTIFNNVLSKITEKKLFIESPPNPTDPDLPVLMENATEDIARMALVLEEISYYKTQIQIDLA